MREVVTQWGHRLAKGFPELLYWQMDGDTRRGLSIRRRDGHIEVRKDDRVIRLSRANFAYVGDVARHIDFFFDAARPDTVDGQRVLDFTGERDHWVTGFDRFAVRCPSLEPWSTVEQYLGLAALRPGDHVIDLGAYAGLSSIAFSDAVGAEGRVVAVEPDPINHRVAAVNFERHRDTVPWGTNLTLLNCAAASREGTLLLTCEGTMGTSHTAIIGRSRGTVQQVRTLTLEQIAATIGHVDFVKMDIEGAETDVIDGAVGFLARTRPRLLIEPHRVRGEMTTGPITAALRAIGYDIAYVDQPGAHQPLIHATVR